MIIECPSCRARFRLDESRIKGRGARVRCRRCGDSIVVLKPKGQDKEDIGGTLDLRSYVKSDLEPEAKPPISVTPAHVSGQSETPAHEPESPTTAQQAPPPLEAETPAAPAAPPAPTADVQPPGKDEIDLAFDRILGSEKEEEAGKPFGLAVDFRPEETVDLRPAESREKKIPLEIEREDFLLSNSDTLDQLKKESGKEPGGEKQETLDISGQLRPEAGIPPPMIFQAPFTPPAPPAEEPPVAAPDFESQLREAEMQAAETAPPLTPPPEPPPKRATIQAQPRETRAAAAPRVRTSLVVLILLFLVLAGGGAYLGFTDSGQELLRGMYPGVETMLRGGKSGPQFDVRNLIGYYEPNSKEGKLFIIKGHVANISRTRKSGIRIHAALLNDKDQAVAETSCYAGNVLPGDVLRKAPRKEIEDILSNRFGEKLVNMDVQPGKTVPFMVVFFSAPADIGAYRLEAKEEE